MECTQEHVSGLHVERCLEKGHGLNNFISPLAVDQVKMIRVKYINGAMTVAIVTRIDREWYAYIGAKYRSTAAQPSGHLAAFISSKDNLSSSF